MPIEILMPALSPTMTEGNLTKWLKKEGDKINPGQVLAEIETDKATMEVEAVDAGKLWKIIVPEGTQNVAINSVIGYILEEGEKEPAQDFLQKAAVIQAPSQQSPVAATPAPTATQAISETNSSKTPHKQPGHRAFISPLAKRIAEQEGVDTDKVHGTGPHARIIKADILDFIASGGAKSKASSTRKVGRATQEYTKIPISNMRKVIARRLLESKQNIPHFYLNLDCNMDKLLEVRQYLNDNAELFDDGRKYKLSVNDFIIKATAKALQQVPAANSAWDNDHILQFNNIDISVAVSIEDGLITPIIHNADQKSIVEISNEMKELASKAKSGKLQPHEFQGGGFSISNLGMYGIKSFNAIVNPPQTCILSVGTTEERVIVINGEMQVATIMNLSLSCDHRVVDGTVGAAFLAALKKILENPLTILIESL